MSKSREDLSSVPCACKFDGPGSWTYGQGDDGDGDDWETDPDGINCCTERDLRWGRCRRSYSMESIPSITSELSKSIRNCEAFNSLHNRTSSVSDIQPNSQEFAGYRKSCTAVGINNDSVAPNCLPAQKRSSQNIFQNEKYHRFLKENNTHDDQRMWCNDDKNVGTQRSRPGMKHYSRKAQLYSPDSRSNSTYESPAQADSDILVNKSRYDNSLLFGRDFNEERFQSHERLLRPENTKADSFTLDNYNETESMMSGLDRTSTFSTNAAQKLDSFLRRKLEVQNTSPDPLASSLCENIDSLYEGINPRSLLSRKAVVSQPKQWNSPNDSNQLVASPSLERIRQVMDKTNHIQNLQIHFERQIQKHNRHREKDQEKARRNDAEMMKKQHSIKGQTKSGCKLNMPAGRRKNESKEDNIQLDNISKCKNCKAILYDDPVRLSEYKDRNVSHTKSCGHLTLDSTTGNFKQNTFKYNGNNQTFDDYMHQHIRQCKTCQNLNDDSGDSSTDSFCDDDRFCKHTNSLKHRRAYLNQRSSGLAKPKPSFLERKKWRVSSCSEEYNDAVMRKPSETGYRNDYYNKCSSSGQIVASYPVPAECEQTCECDSCRLLDCKKQGSIRAQPQKSIHKLNNSLKYVDSNIYCRPSRSWHKSEKYSDRQPAAQPVAQATSSFSDTDTLEIPIQCYCRFCQKHQRHHISNYTDHERKPRKGRSSSRRRHGKLEATSSLEKMAPRLRRKDRVRVIAKAFDKRDRKDIEHAEKELAWRQLQEEECKKKMLALKEHRHEGGKKSSSSRTGAGDEKSTKKSASKQYSRNDSQHGKRTEKSNRRHDHSSKKYR